MGSTSPCIGQVDDDESPYKERIESLRKTFPYGRFIAGSVTEEFEMIRRARNKVVAISTFSWIAAWLGLDDSRIVLPVTGFLNPSA